MAEVFVVVEGALGGEYEEGRAWHADRTPEAVCERCGFLSASEPRSKSVYVGTEPSHAVDEHKLPSAIFRRSPNSASLSEYTTHPLSHFTAELLEWAQASELYSPCFNYLQSCAFTMLHYNIAAGWTSRRHDRA